jgi:hypothetical protein
VRALRPADPPVRQVPRRGWAIRSVLRVLRLRDGAGPQAAAVVATMVPGRVASSGAGTHLRNRPSAIQVGDSSPFMGRWRRSRRRGFSPFMGRWRRSRRRGSSPFMGRWRRSRRRGAPEGLLPIYGEVAAQPPEGTGLAAVQAVAALDAEAVPAQVVVAARWTDQAPRWVGLQPALVLAPVPDAVLRTEHPSTSFVVEHREVADRDPERAGLKIAHASLLGEELVAVLRIGERIDSHGGRVCRRARLVKSGTALWAPQHASHHFS